MLKRSEGCGGGGGEGGRGEVVPLSNNGSHLRSVPFTVSSGPLAESSHDRVTEQCSDIYRLQQTTAQINSSLSADKRFWLWPLVMVCNGNVTYAIGNHSSWYATEMSPTQSEIIRHGMQRKCHLRNRKSFVMVCNGNVTYAIGNHSSWYATEM